MTLFIILSILSLLALLFCCHKITQHTRYETLWVCFTIITAILVLWFTTYTGHLMGF